MADADLVKSADVLGKGVFDASGAKVGTIREVYFLPASGEARFAVVEPGALFGAAKFHPVPWRLLHRDALTGDYVTALTKDQFKATPAYDREQLAGTAYGWSEQVERYFADAGHA